jgi:CRP/FNR family transcriptional regulator
MKQEPKRGKSMATMSRKPGICVSRMIPELANLPKPILAELNALGQMRKLAAGQLLADAGDAFDIIGFVTDGILRMQKTLPDGRQHVVGLLVSGDMFGRVFDGPMQFTLEAATDCTLLNFRRGPFEALLTRCAELDRIILLQFLSEIDRSRDWMIVLSNPRVRGRLAGFLLMLCTRFHKVEHLFGTMNGRLTIRVPISRADVSQLLGARAESISRAFHALADDGILDIIRPDLVAVLNMEDLAAEAGEPELIDAISDEILTPAQGKALH